MRHSYGLTALVVAGLTFYVGTAHAQSTGEKVIEHLNKTGFIAEPMMGQRKPCPCKLLGVSREGNTDTVFVATKGNEWFAFTCTSVKGGTESTLCRMSGQVMGQAWSQ